jgi:hypothetical protein
MASSKASKNLVFILVRMGSEGYRGVGKVDEVIVLMDTYGTSIRLIASPVFLRSLLVHLENMESQLGFLDD